ncbi:hypothetical protein Y1Q_0001897 [Alligator mississippiensis]|uniref:Uncharacterized protein n=1 Tax=Alligator mississippiensis TaxID=8496 RepID=A0A151PGC7_ALLMI|nr:hypothetical protein Y1Q_0001897 [Alligator mississippiensis]
MSSVTWQSHAHLIWKENKPRSICSRLAKKRTFLNGNKSRAFCDCVNSAASRFHNQLYPSSVGRIMTPLIAAVYHLLILKQFSNWTCCGLQVNMTGLY